MIEYTISRLDTINLNDLHNVELIDSPDGFLDGYVAKCFPFPNGIKVVSEDVLDYLLAIVRGERDKALKELKNTQKLKMKVGALESQIKRYKDEIESLKKTLKEYDNTYGKHISPFAVINELYTGTKLPYMILLKRESFKMKVSPKQFNYWVGIFMDLKILRRIDKSRLQSLVTYEDAHNILYQHDYTWNGRDLKALAGVKDE